MTPLTDSCFARTVGIPSYGPYKNLYSIQSVRYIFALCVRSAIYFCAALRRTSIDAEPH